jgi:hypothetical protein
VDYADEIKDTSILKFTSTFYEELFSGRCTVCEAFNKAVESVSFDLKDYVEANKFIILRKSKGECCPENKICCSDFRDLN